MKLELKRHSIHIVPENEMEVAYLEAAIGFDDAQALTAKRQEAHGFARSLAYIRIVGNNQHVAARGSNMPEELEKAEAGS